MIEFFELVRYNSDESLVFWRSYINDLKVTKDASTSSFGFLGSWFGFGCSKFWLGDGTFRF